MRNNAVIVTIDCPKCDSVVDFEISFPLKVEGSIAVTCSECDTVLATYRSVDS